VAHIIYSVGCWPQFASWVCALVAERAGGSGEVPGRTALWLDRPVNREKNIQWLGLLCLGL
jgi:hypothetical protein